MPKPAANELLEGIRQMEQIRDEAEAAGDVERTREAVRLLGIMWQAFSKRMGQSNRRSEEFERLYERPH